MPRHPRHAALTVGGPPITPATSVTLSVTHVLLVVGAVLVFGSSVGTMIVTSVATRSDVLAIKEQLPAAIKDQDEKRAKALADQDERRNKMAESFLLSNKAIADKVGELNTMLAVSQERQRATYEKLTEQLNLVARGGTRPAKKLND